MQAILASNKVKSDRIQEKLKGEATLYMGDPSLQWATGGWVRGRANLVYGPFGSGKSTLSTMGAAIEQQKTGGVVLVFDSEYAYKDPHEVDENGNPTQDAISGRSRLTKAGLDWERVLIKRSSEMDILFEDLSQIKEDLADDPNCVAAVIVDSWGGVQSEGAKKKIADGDLSGAGNSFGGSAKAMGPILQELLNLAAENAVTVFIVQHCIKNMDQYGPKYLLLGGERLKFLCHGILFVESVQAKDASLLAGGVATTKETKSDEIVERAGKKIRFACEKSRNVVEGRKGEFWIDFENIKFALPEVSLFTLAEKLGVVDHPAVPELNKDGSPKLDKDGSPVVKVNKMWWEFPVGAPTPNKFHGAKGTIEALRTNKELFDEVFNECMNSKRLSALSKEDN